MEKMPMCRICLVQNVRMYVVADENLQEIYEKLTDIPFVTEDSRPVLACVFCYAKLKQCGQLQRTCLKAEEMFAQMLNKDYEPNPLLKQGLLEFSSGFIKSPTVLISIFDECQAKSEEIKEELPDVCERQEDIIIEPKKEPQSDELELEYQDIEYLDSLTDQEDMVQDNSELEDIIKPPQQSELELIPSHQSESDSLIHSEWCDGIFFRPDYKPSMKFKTEVEREQEVSKKKQRANNKNRPTVAKKPRRAKREDTKDEEKKSQPRDSNFIQTVPNRASKYVTKVNEPVTTGNTTVTDIDERIEKLNKPNITELTNNLSTAIDTNCRTNSNKDNLMRKIRNNKGINSVTNRLKTLYKEKPLKCDICSREFKTKSNLNQHIFIHTGEKPYKCDVCQRSFILKFNLTQHIRIHSGEKPYKCDICQLSFAHKNSCKNHIQTHTGEKPYKCDVCQRSFTLKNSCKIHIRTHTGEKPYKCDVCQRSFSHKYSLICHIRLHTGEKTFKCDICHRIFTVKIHLREHILTHTGEKPYKCDICQHSFIKKYNLKNHIQTHTGEKPYKCDVCQRSFAVKQYLTNHARNHTVERPYKCDICQRSFNFKGRLNSHILTHE